MPINQNEYIHAMAEDPETGKPMQKVKVEGLESNSIQPTEIQARYATTIQTHSGVTIAPSTSANSVWVDCDGFDKVAVTFVNGGGTSNYVALRWSNDNSNLHGLETVLATTTDQYRAVESMVKARYLQVQVYNGHTAPVTVNSWILLKA